MNFSKKTLGMIIAGLVVLALVVVGLFAFAGSRANSSVPGEENVSPSASPSATSSAAPSEQPLNTTTDPAEAKKEFEETKKFDDAKETEGFTQEEIQNVLQVATDYTYAGLTNPYYLGGEWEEAGNPNNLDGAVGRFFTNDIRKKIEGFNTDPKTSTTLGTDVFPLVFFVRPNGNITASEVCRTDYQGDAKFSCPMEGVEFSDMTYVPTAENDVPGVRVTYTATIKVPVKMDGTKDVFTTVRYDYDLNFVRNEDFNEEVNPNKFVINWYKVQTNMSAVEDIK